jgi:elongation factor 1-gamma
MYIYITFRTFVMDAFKREYSNEDTVSKAIPYFWKHFDKENCSIWYCEYKYPEDLRMVFMACNLVSGMFQRLGKLAKHGFGSILIFGTDNDCSISGVWVFRGQKLGFEVCFQTGKCCV